MRRVSFEYEVKTRGTEVTEKVKVMLVLTDEHN